MSSEPLPGEVVKEYTNGEITVVWRPDMCIHSTNCWRQMIEVFNPRARPWVNMDGGTSQEIADQVGRCPSGALAVRWHHGQSAAARATDPMFEVEVTENGPLLVQGPVLVKNHTGEPQEHPIVVALCRCGASANKPYCDGSHGRVGFKG